MNALRFSTFSALFLLALSAGGCASQSNSDEAGSDEGAVAASQPFFCPTTEDNEFYQNAGSSNESALLVAARAAGHPELGVDRFVLEFANNGATPAFTVLWQYGTTFSSTGETNYTLAGTSGLGVYVHGASAGWPIDDNTPKYTGPTNIKPGDTTKLREAQYIEDFEANLAWGLGTDGATNCFRAYRLTNPPRLVVDIKR
jgi:hypothetical protein